MSNKQYTSTILKSPVLLNALPIGIIVYFIPIYSRELGMTTVEIAGLSSIMSFILLVSKPIIGKLIDSVGRKPILVASCIFFFISYFILIIADNGYLMYVSNMSRGFAHITMAFSTYAIISDISSKEELGTEFAKVATYSTRGSLYGCIVAGITFSFMRFEEGFSSMFIVFTIASIWALVNVIKNVPETKQSKEANGSDYFNKPSKENTKGKGMHKSSNMMGILIIVFISSLAMSVTSPIFMVYLMDNFATNLYSLTLVFFPALIIQSIYGYKIGHICDKFGNKKSMILGMFIFAAVQILIPNISSIKVLTIVWIVYVLGGMLEDIAERSIYSSESKESSIGMMFGVYSLVANVAAMIGPLIGGYLYDNVSNSAPFYLSGAILLIATGLIFLLIKEKTYKNIGV